MSLLKETIDVIEESNMSVDDVEWVGSCDGAWVMSWDWFASISDIDYDSGYGAPEVAQDLVVVFRDGSWLERYEYDGAECWRHKRRPYPKNSPEIPVRVIHPGGWMTLADINETTPEGI